MKKGILVLMLMVLSGVAFAQEVSYGQVREKIVQATERVTVFPKNFYVTTTSPDYTDIYQQREDIIQTAYNVYRANPNNKVAAFNYANVVLKFGRLNGDGETAVNNPQEAARIMKKLGATEEKSQSNDEIWLKSFEQRLQSGSGNLTAQDYHRAGAISEKIGQHAAADMYYEMERNAGCENMD